jgi:hypothetical protein
MQCYQAARRKQFMYVKSGDFGDHLLKRLCQPTVGGSLGRFLSNFLHEKLPYTYFFPARTPVCDTDAREQNAHWARQTEAKFILPTVSMSAAPQKCSQQYPR